MDPIVGSAHLSPFAHWHKLFRLIIHAAIFESRQTLATALPSRVTR